MTVQALLANISSSELTEWKAFYFVRADKGESASDEDGQDWFMRNFGHKVIKPN